MNCELAFGTAGWSYDDWVGIVYPSQKPSKNYHPLRYLLPFIDAVEINVTYYRPISPRTTKSWIRILSEKENMKVITKLWQTLTHELELTEANIHTFLYGIEPFFEYQGFMGVLAQFPYRFHATEQNLAYIRTLCESLHHIRVFCEFRHVSWLKARVIHELQTIPNCEWVTIDHPRAGYSSMPFSARIFHEWGYLRLHGRNRSAWFHDKAGRNERYNYFYSTAELKNIWKRFASVLTRARGGLVIANNHFAGKGLANILTLKALVQGQPVPAPPSLRKSYPEIERFTYPYNSE